MLLFTIKLLAVREVTLILGEEILGENKVLVEGLKVKREGRLPKLSANNWIWVAPDPISPNINS